MNEIEILEKILNSEKANFPYTLDISDRFCFFSKGEDWETNPILSEFFGRVPRKQIYLLLKELRNNSKFKFTWVKGRTILLTS